MIIQRSALPPDHYWIEYRLLDQAAAYHGFALKETDKSKIKEKAIEVLKFNRIDFAAVYIYETMPVYEI